jgi:hypothetical protein
MDTMENPLGHIQTHARAHKHIRTLKAARLATNRLLNCRNLSAKSYTNCILHKAIILGKKVYRFYSVFFFFIQKGSHFLRFSGTAAVNVLHRGIRHWHQMDKTGLRSFKLSRNERRRCQTMLRSSHGRVAGCSRQRAAGNYSPCPINLLLICDRWNEDVSKEAKEATKDKGKGTP